MVARVEAIIVLTSGRLLLRLRALLRRCCLLRLCDRLRLYLLLTWLVLLLSGLLRLDLWSTAPAGRTLRLSLLLGRSCRNTSVWTIAVVVDSVHQPHSPV
jgi:hypothetical protein